MFIPNNVKIQMRAGGSYARGTTIDLYLAPAEIETLYKRWNNAWGEIYVLQGGEKAITCEMVNEVSLFDLTQVYGRTLAAKLKEVAGNHSII